MVVRVTSKGQVTIPIQIRDQLGLHAGTEVRFEVEGRAVRLRKVDGTDREFQEWLDRSSGSMKDWSTDEIMRLTRGE